MIIKSIVDEDFVNYKHPVMYIGAAHCNGKCCKDAGTPLSMCQNDEWRSAATVDMDDEDIIARYLSNDITSAICFAGLEPFEQFEEMLALITKLRQEHHCDDTVVIYTGYNKNEIALFVNELGLLGNIIIKFGRFVPGHTQHFDEVLGVYLSSDNQYAEVIS